MKTVLVTGASRGIGAACAAVPMTIYQGGIALLAGVLAPLLTDVLINEMSAVGSILIVALSLNMLGVTKERIRVGNMLPAILVPCVYIPVANWISMLL